MAGYESSGNETVDALKGLQITASRIGDPEAKLARIRETLTVIRATQLLGDSLMISAQDVWGVHPDAAPGDMIRFRQEMVFIAELDAFGYMLDPSVPVDTLTFDFEAPEVWGVLPEDALAFRSLTLRVPVLAIDSCVPIPA